MLLFVFFFPFAVLRVPFKPNHTADGGEPETPRLPHRSVRLLHSHPARPEGGAALRGNGFYQRAGPQRRHRKTTWTFKRT